MKKTRPNLPIVAIVGRANVGKSTLWNRLIESSRALISSEPNTTRDRNYAVCLWRGQAVQMVDTGGMDTDQTEMGRGILRQAELAIREADIVLFMVDAKDGIMPQDLSLAKSTSKLNKNIMLVANKSDKAAQSGQAMSKELYKLNLGDPKIISAANGRGIGDLMDDVYIKLKKLGREPVDYAEDQSLRIVIMGRPNVGKSSLMNAILGEERSLVSPVAHTTREPLDTEFLWKGERVTLIDTAGMRKRAKVSEYLEKEAIERNRTALSRADVAVLVIDATDDPRKQDKILAGLLMDAKKGLIIVVNKWDLIPNKDTKTADEFAVLIKQSLPFLSWAPILFTSAKDGLRVDDILTLAFRIKQERERIIEDNALSKFFKQAIAIQPPRAASGPKQPYIATIIQTRTNPPTFVFTVRGTQISIHDSWMRFFENRLRDKFGFLGTAMVFKIDYDVSPLEKLHTGPKRKKRPMGRRVGRY